MQLNILLMEKFNFELKLLTTLKVFKYYITTTKLIKQL